MLECKACHYFLIKLFDIIIPHADKEQGKPHS